MTAPALLTPARAATLEAAVRADLTSALAHLDQLRDGGAHLLAGFDTWAAYAVDRFGDLLGKLLPVEERRAVVAELRRAGRSNRGIADDLGISPSLAQKDRQALKAAGVDVEPEKVIGLDDRRRPAQTGTREPAPVSTAAPVAFLPVPGMTKADELVARLTAHGPAGATARQLEDETGWRHGSVSAALHRLTVAGRIAYTRPAKRGQESPYTAVPVAAS